MNTGTTKNICVWEGGGGTPNEGSVGKNVKRSWQKRNFIVTRSFVKKDICVAKPPGEGDLISRVGREVKGGGESDLRGWKKTNFVRGKIRK